MCALHPTKECECVHILCFHGSEYLICNLIMSGPLPPWTGGVCMVVVVVVVICSVSVTSSPRWGWPQHFNEPHHVSEIANAQPQEYSLPSWATFVLLPLSLKCFARFSSGQQAVWLAFSCAQEFCSSVQSRKVLRRKGRIYSSLLWSLIFTRTRLWFHSSPYLFKHSMGKCLCRW